MSKHNGWIGVDLDGTLAEYHGWDGGKIGKPVPRMLERVKMWIATGEEVRIFTARVGEPHEGLKNVEQRRAIEAWCVEHIGVKLEVTATKDFRMFQLWDDRAIQVVANTGQPAVEAVIQRVLKDVGLAAAVHDEPPWPKVKPPGDES